MSPADWTTGMPYAASVDDCNVRVRAARRGLDRLLEHSDPRAAAQWRRLNDLNAQRAAVWLREQDRSPQ